ncbi:glucokinase [Granulosicoccus antarcticus]|uniref:Glucokinase n=1 Tax=Granulosicoccus antarcticus IMCC3135 TaxID=1192854 RepID=A0A2Z2NMN0_9GAMM|nr:glucokinase [Granulosicoccus antarcticus]ASJ72473.1 Glucokinase [Granulosicoccus antarcticus IMCC3135]
MSHNRLVGDVGGTNARFALLDDNNQPISSSTSTLRTDDFPSLAAAVSTYLSEHDIDRVTAAAVAVATPVVGDVIKLTNNHWSFSIEETRKQLGIDCMHVVNDFTALALSVPHLPASELIKVGGGEEVPNHAKAIIGPGTGLGVSGLIPCNGHWTALQGEGGHVSLGVRTPREFAVYELLSHKFRHVSAERFLSGPGLVNIVNALREIDGMSPHEYSPADVTEHGLASEPLPEHAACVEALDIFCELLGSCAGNLVLTLGAEGGVYIGGGVVPRLGDFFLQSGFREQFEAKGRMQHYLEKVPSYVIKSPYPALVGAAQLI